MKKLKTHLRVILVYSALFATLCFIGFNSIYGQNRTFVWSVDSAGQYFPAFVYIGKYLQRFFSGLLKGEFILPQYDLAIGMGESVIGTLNYYGFGDPFNLIAVFVNGNNAAGLFAFSYFLRLFAAGLAMMYYLFIIGIDSRIRPLGAICYVFSGFGIIGCLMYYSWTSALVLLPLVLCGIEKILRNKKDCVLFILSVAFGGMCGFYFLYMISIALVFYCLARFLSVNFQKNKFEFKKFVFDILLCVIFYLVGIIISSPFLIPALKAFLSSERNSSAFNIITDFHYYIPHLSAFLEFVKASLIPAKYDFRIGILAIMWLMMIAVFFLPNTRRRVLLKIAVGLVLLSPCMKITGYVFNAFGETNDRYVFLIAFLASVVMCDNANYIISGDFLEKYSRNKLHLQNENNGLYKTKFLTLYCIIVFYVLSVANILFNMNGLFSNNAIAWNREFIGKPYILNVLYSPVSNFEEIRKDYEGGEVFRVALDHYSIANDRPENLAMFNGYYGMTYWFSIVNGNVQRYVDEYNGDEMIWRSYGLNNDKYASALAGCKYFVVHDGEELICNRNDLYKGFAFSGSKDKLAQIEESTLDFSSRSKAVYDSADYSAVSNVRYDNLCGKFECRAKGDDNADILVTAIPYDKGWKATVNGKREDVLQVEMYCAVNLCEGENTVELYR